MNSVAVHKKNRYHDSSLLLWDYFGIKDKFVYNVPSRPKIISHLFNFLFAPNAARKLKNHDTFFFEGLSCATILPHLKKINPDAVIIAKGNSHEPYFIEKDWKWKQAYKGLDLDKNLSGMIAVSDMVKEDFQKNFTFPIVVAEGFLYRNWDDLKKNRSKPGNRNFIFVGRNPYLKGVDIMVNVFLRLKKENVLDKDTKFYLLGEHKVFLKKQKYDFNELYLHGIRMIDYNLNIEEYLKDSFFQFHFARYEPNAVALMEGMATRHLPIISGKTGNKMFIKETEPALIIESFNEQDIFNRIKEILSWDNNRYARTVSDLEGRCERYKLENGLKRWKEAWEYLLKQAETRTDQ